MASVLSDIIDFSQPQRVPAELDTTLARPTSPMLQDPPVINDSDPSSDSEDDDDDDNAHTPSGTLDSNPVAAFTINTARNLRLTVAGEKSLLEFSQVFLPSFYTTLTRFTQHPSLM